MAVTIDNQSGTAHAAYANVKETFPVSAAPTSGTITIVAGQPKLVVGTTTVFLTDFNVGDYIWFTSTDELRRIESISSDTELILQQPVAGAITAQAFKTIKAIGYKTISWANDITGVSNINGVAFPSGISSSYEGKKVLLIDSTVGGGTVSVMAEM
jgi:hypothetical protein